MGSDYAFMGNQYKLENDGQEFFIDLLLYHRRLKSLIAIELKIGVFKPEYAGKINFYLALLDDKVHLDSENSSIGIIICKDKSKTIVEYALKKHNQTHRRSHLHAHKNTAKRLGKAFAISKRDKPKIAMIF